MVGGIKKHKQRKAEKELVRQESVKHRIAKEETNIPIFVFTSNKYIHLTRIYAHLFNKFWSPDRKVTILGYDSPNFELPDNFEFVSLGKQMGGTENWSNPLREYISGLNDKHIIWSTEDLFLIDDVDFYVYNYLVSFTTNDDNVGRAGLTKDILMTETELLKSERLFNVVQKSQDALFRIGGIWSLWNREYLLKYLKPDMTPWQFENQKEANNDGYKIIGTSRLHTLSFCGSINSGPKYKDNERTDILNNPLDFRDFQDKYKFKLDDRYILELREMGYIDENNIAIRPL